MPRLILFLVLVFAPFTAPYAAAPSTNVYEIEIVVFENRLTGLEGGEFWLRAKEKTDDAADMKDAVVAGVAPAADTPLAAAVAALKNSGQHRVLAHLRWQQGAEAKSLSKPVKIISIENGLDGALRFYLSRFLLVDVGLTLKEAAGGALSGGVENDGIIYRLNERRRVKLSETHYFDHPKFGALVRVAPAKTN